MVLPALYIGTLHSIGIGPGERQGQDLVSEILALQLPAARGAVLDLFGISLARFYIIEENPSVMPFGPPELSPQFVCFSARAIQLGHRLTSLIGTS
jgi:hypothetical protein